MAGYSKWASIQHRKSAPDTRRVKIFNKFIREISMAARVGGAGQGSNSRLRLAVDRARAQSVPQDAIENAVKRAAEGEPSPTLEIAKYEGYGPGGAAVIVHCLTDNPDRTVADVRTAFALNGGNLGADGSVSYLFNQVGLMTYPPGTCVDRLMAAALDAGAEDVLCNDDGTLEVLTDPMDFETVQALLIASGLPPTDGDITQRASTTVTVDGPAAESLVQLLVTLEDLDDVQNVYSNAEIPDEVLARV